MSRSSRDPPASADIARGRVGMDRIGFRKESRENEETSRARGAVTRSFDGSLHVRDA